MSPIVRPKSAQTLREELEAAAAEEARVRQDLDGASAARFSIELHRAAAEADEMAAEEQREFEANHDALRRAKMRVQLRDRTPYGPDSEHSWILDRARTVTAVGDVAAKDRLDRFEMTRQSGSLDVETRAISTTTLGGIVPGQLPPWVAEAVAYGVRSTAPLALALERLDLPPEGMSAYWAKATTATTVGGQTSQNTAITQSADTVVASATDPLQTVGAFVDFSAQTQERSGGWFDRIIGEELGRAFGTRLESQLWSGSGSSGQFTGFTVMTGNSSATVAGQTLGNQTAKIWAQYDAVTTNLGAAPDLIAMASRRAGGIGSLAAALGLQLENVIPMEPRENIIVSPAAPVNLGAGTNEDWVLILNRAAVPLVRNAEPTLEFHQQGPSAGTNLTFRWLIRSYVTLGVSRRPEGVGLIKGLTAPTY